MLGLSTGAANAVNDVGYGPMFDGGNGRLAILTGSQPTNKDAALADTLLGTLTLASDVFGASSARVITANAITNDSDADASGTPGYGVFYRTTDTALGSAAGATDRRMFVDIGPRTTLNGAINNVVTTITVADTTYFPASGTLYIDSEQITYTGKTATTFTGLTRGANGTTAASHSNGAGVTIFGKDLNFDNTAFALHGVIAVSSFTITQ